MSAYFSAEKTTLKLLDTIHHSTLCIPAGSFHTTPCTSLYTLCNKLLPHLHLKFRIVRFVFLMMNLDRTLVSMDNPIVVNEPYARSGLTNQYLANLESIGRNHLDLTLSSEKITEEWTHRWQNIIN